MNNSWLITGGRLVDPVAGRDEIADLLIVNGVIAPLTQEHAGIPTLDATGWVVAPGFIDMHAHLREPGAESAETILSGSRAAARGGFTAVVAMPNTTPAIDNPERITQLRTAGDRHGYVVVLPAGCITRGRNGRELADLAGMAAVGAVAFTDDGATVPDERLMESALGAARKINRPILDHALDAILAGRGAMHQGPVAERMGVPGIPSEAEVKIVLRDIHLAARTGCAVHIQHVSTKEAVEALRAARARGVRISAEATPHHLALVDSDVPALGVNGKMNPPLRSATDREAILSGVADGTLEAFASDHAPHTPAAKSAPFATAPFGVIGLETAVGVTYTVLVQSGLLTLAEWIQRWTAGPARILGRNPPTLAPGRSADIVLLDIEHPWTVRTAEFLSLSRNTPFEDCELYGRAVRTLLRGICTWAEEGAPGNTPAD